MAAIYENGYNRSMLLYENGGRILLRHKSGESIGRPVILANDFGEGLTDVRCSGTIYYAYINETGQLILRSISDQHILYQVKDAAQLVCHKPRLAAFMSQLLLFYIEQNTERQTFFIRCAAPFRRDLALPGELARSAGCLFQSCPSLDVTATGNLLFVIACTKKQSLVIRIDETFRILPQQESSAQEIARLNAMIESATRQYNELKSVAEQYRDEALKWREKFYISSPG